jgi:folylpolyglutamate synthase/dihydropteroate synthase
LGIAELKQKATEVGLRTVFSESVNSALAKAMDRAGADDLVLVIGSHLVVQDAIKFHEKKYSLSA